MNATDWLTPRQAADLVPGASASTLRRWVKQGKIKGVFVNPSGRMHIPITGLIDLLGFDPRVEPSQSPAPPTGPDS
jgi:predicted site-specific integrase-resolvase